MFWAKFSCFGIWKVETNVGQPYFNFKKKSVATPSLKVFLIFRDEYHIGWGS